VWDIYREDIEFWQERRQMARDLLKTKKKRIPAWLGGKKAKKEEADVLADVDPGLRAFMELEKKLKERKEARSMLRRSRYMSDISSFTNDRLIMEVTLCNVCVIFKIDGGPSARSVNGERTSTTHYRQTIKLEHQEPGGYLLTLLFACILSFLPLVLRSWIGLSPAWSSKPIPASPNEFRLVSIHRAGVGKRRSQVYQVLDIPPTSDLHTQLYSQRTYFIPSITRQTTRLSNQSRESISSYMTHSRLQSQTHREPLSNILPQPPSINWITHDIHTPNITDQESVTTLAKVASNAYIRIPDTEDWYDLGHKWNESNDFGWEENGLRGHVFANGDNSTILVAMKGTSPPFVGGSDTSTNDKINV
jgi:hypothetical protein